MCLQYCINLVTSERHQTIFRLLLQLLLAWCCSFLSRSSGMVINLWLTSSQLLWWSCQCVLDHCLPAWWSCFWLFGRIFSVDLAANVSVDFWIHFKIMGSIIKLSEPAPEAAMQAEAMALRTSTLFDQSDHMHLIMSRCCFSSHFGIFPLLCLSS